MRALPCLLGHHVNNPLLGLWLRLERLGFLPKKSFQNDPVFIEFLYLLFYVPINKLPFLQKMAAHALSRLPTSTPISQSDCRRPDSLSLSLPRTLTLHSIRSSWLGTTKLSLHSSNLRFLMPKHRPITATVSFSLPTAKPERVSSTDKIPKWSSKAIKSFVMAELEARKLKYPTTGTEALLMGVLLEGTSLAAKFLRANGITLFKVREETVKLLGKADMYFFSPEHPPLTESAQRALDWAIDEKLKSGDSGEITTTHLLLGVWSEEDSPGHEILATLGFNHEKAQELKSLSSEPGFVDG